MPILQSTFGLSIAGAGVFPAGAFESIARVTVGSGGASSITFSDIPGTYQHLQVRGLHFGGVGWITLRMNGDTGSNYAVHFLRGSGATASAQSSISQSSISLLGINGSSSTAPAASIVDILDYSQTSKTKVVRTSTGFDWSTGTVPNDSFAGMASGLWNSTAAVTQLTFTMTLNQHSTLALYGIKAP